MIVETSSLMHMMNSIKAYNDSTTEGDSMSIDHENYSTDTVSSSLPNRLSIMQAVNDIRERISVLNRAQDVESTRPVNIQFECMEGNSTAFQFLLQKWTKDSFVQTHADIQGRLCFDLPETLDRTMCQLSLDLQYSVFPYPVNSRATMDLVEDMKNISQLSPSSVEVLQTIPLSMVDAKLIHGVSMLARPAFENDEQRDNEMKALARQLWIYLGRNDLALVLRVRSSDYSNDDGATDSLVGGEDDQLFLLVCEENVQKQPSQDGDGLASALQIQPNTGIEPCNGVLYRYAIKSQMLHFGKEDEYIGAEEENSKEIDEMYSDYISSALDTLVSTGLNPLLLGKK